MYIENKVNLDFNQQLLLIGKALNKSIEEDNPDYFKYICDPDLGLIKPFIENVALYGSSSGLALLKFLVFDPNYRINDKYRILDYFLDARATGRYMCYENHFKEGGFGYQLIEMQASLFLDEKTNILPLKTYIKGFDNFSKQEDFFEGLIYLWKQSEVALDDKLKKSCLNTLLMSRSVNPVLLINALDEIGVDIPIQMQDMFVQDYLNDIHLTGQGKRIDVDKTVSDVAFLIDRFDLNVNELRHIGHEYDQGLGFHLIQSREIQRPGQYFPDNFFKELTGMLIEKGLDIHKEIHGRHKQSLYQWGARGLSEEVRDFFVMTDRQLQEVEPEVDLMRF